MTRAVNKETGDGNIVVAGVEFDPLGRIAAYHLRANPDLGYVATQATRVVAADVVHLFEKRWPGQVRGLSWLAPVASRIVELDALEDAGLVKAKTSALLCGFIKSLDGTGTVAADMQALQPMEPGAMVELAGRHRCELHADERHARPWRLHPAHDPHHRRRHRLAV